jgi:hypothetical protein
MSQLSELTPADLDAVAAMMFVSFRDLSPGWLPSIEAAREQVADFLASDYFTRVVPLPRSRWSQGRKRRR